MRIITSEYIENKLKKLESNDILAGFLLLSYDDKLLGLNKIINDNILEIKKLRRNKNSYIVDKELKPEVKNIIDKLKLDNNIYREYIKILKKKHVLDLENNKLSKIDFDENIINLTSQQLKILDKVINNRQYKSSYSDLVFVCRYIIANYSVETYEKEVLKIIKQLLEMISFNTKIDDQIIIGLNAISNEITRKAVKLGKDSFERKILNNFKNLIKSVISISKITFMESYDYKFDIIEYWLNNEENKIFIEKLFNRIPETVNIRTTNNEHIMNYILNKYIEAYKIELKNQSKPNVSSLYLKHILMLLLNNKNLELLDSDNILFSTTLEQFEQFLKNSSYQRERVLDAIKDLDDIKGISEENEEFEEYDEIDVNNQLLYIKDIINMENNNKQRIDLTNEDTFVISNSNLKYYNYSYIINRVNHREYSVKLNVVDIEALINEGSPLDLYLRNKLFSNINKDDYLFFNVNDFSLNENKKMPTITFEMLINEKGEVINFECYKSVSKVTNVIDNQLKLGDNNISSYYQLLCILNSELVMDTRISNLEELINQQVIRSVAKYFDENNYPFIYKVQNEQDSNVFEKNINALNGIFYKIGRDDFRIIYSIICEDYNFAYYSTNNIGHKNKKSKYYSDLLNPLDSYIGICLQRLINEYYFSKNNGYVDTFTMNYLQSVVERANNYKTKVRKNKQKVL